MLTRDCWHLSLCNFAKKMCKVCICNTCQCVFCLRDILKPTIKKWIFKIWKSPALVSAQGSNCLTSAAELTAVIHGVFPDLHHLVLTSLQVGDLRAWRVHDWHAEKSERGKGLKYGLFWQNSNQWNSKIVAITVHSAYHVSIFYNIKKSYVYFLPLNSLWPSDIIWWHRSKTKVNIGSGNVLFADNIKPLPQPMLTN